MGGLGITQVKEFITLDDVLYRFVSSSGSSYRYETEDGSPIFVDESDAIYYKVWVEEDDFVELEPKQFSKSDKPLYSLRQRVLPSCSILMNPPYSSMRRSVWFEALRYCESSRFVTPLRVLKIYNRLKYGKHD